MPTVLNIMGWRLFFYSNEGNEPIHIHCQKGDKECKYWLEVISHKVRQDSSYNMNNKDNEHDYNKTTNNKCNMNNNDTTNNCDLSNTNYDLVIPYNEIDNIKWYNDEMNR